jgi:Mrp family chromosome partitioning ATPase/predicted Fe-Mo cluster-binding NifX family protein
MSADECMSGDQDTSADEALQEMIIEEKLGKIDNILIVLSGKGGVGKSTVAANLTLSLSLQGFRTGILDVDIHGPSIPKLLGIDGQRMGTKDDELLPIECYANVNVVSMALLLQSMEQAVIWRGPMKAKVIRELIQHVAWGKLDYLVVDCPPGTGDEPLSVAQILGKKARAVIVTTPQEVAVIDVEKCLTFCNQLGLPVAGIIENMSGYVCSHCGTETDIFSHGGGEKLAQKFSVPFLGKIPIEPEIARSGDEGKPYLYFYGKSQTVKRFEEIVQNIVKTKTNPEKQSAAATVVQNNNEKKIDITQQEASMKFAVPTNDGKLCQHFGHCEAFALIDIDGDNTIISETYVTPPPHEPGLLPPWLSQQGVNCIIAGGMGSRAQQLFAENSVKVVTGAQGEYPKEVVENYLKGTLITGTNTCDH